MKWWDQLWLNEGFATFVEYLGVDAVLPEWDLWGFFSVHDVQRALNVDSLQSTHPLHFLVEKPGEIDAMFNTITYSKGGSILRMLQSYIGPEPFRQGLARYLDTYKYGNAQTVDLWNALDGDGSGKVAALMHVWTEDPGYPLITLTDNKDGTLTVTQKRFFTKEPELPEAGLWQVPLGIRYADRGFTEYILLETTQTTIPFNGTWMIPNSDCRGYFRVNYPSAMWDAFVEELKKPNSNLTEVERAALMDDAFELSQAGYYSPVMPLNLTRAFLGLETSYPVWYAATKSLGFVNRMLDVQYCYGDYLSFVAALAGPMSETMGWNVTGGSHAQDSTRPLVASLAGAFGYPSAVAQARSLFAAMQQGGYVVPDIRGAVYDTIIRHGGSEEYEWVWNAYLSSSFPSEQARLLSALAKAPDLWMIRLTLERALSDDVRAQDAVSLIEHVALASPQGRDGAWQFLRENWNVIVDRYGRGQFTMERLLSNVLSGFSSEWRAQEISAFFQAHPIPGSGEAGVKSALESITANMAWLKDNLKDVCDALPGMIP